VEQDVFWYIKLFYNQQRRHAALGSVSPAQFEAHAVINRTA
jgi:transposase InsO family protein